MKTLTKEKPRTSQSLSSLSRYLQEIGKIELLTPEEETVLAQKIRTGAEDASDALDKLTKANLRFVVSIAKQYQNQELPLSDLIN